MLPGKNLELVVFVNHLAIGRNNEGSIKEFPGKLGVFYLGLGDDVGVVLFGLATQGFGFFAGDIQCHLIHVFLVVPIEDLVGEALQAAFGYANQANREVNVAEPHRGVDQF